MVVVAIQVMALSNPELAAGPDDAGASYDALALAIDRIEQAVTHLEGLAAARAAEAAELRELRLRHRKLKDSVAGELQQLDLLLANLPK